MFLHVKKGELMPIKDKDLVSVHYVGTFEDGTEFDRSTPDSPLQFTVGNFQVIEGFEKAVIGKEKGDTIKVTIPPVEAYGEYDEELVFAVPKKDLPETITPEIGLHLQLSTDQGEVDVVIADITEEEIFLDANHPMAGEALTFEITIL